MSRTTCASPSAAFFTSTNCRRAAEIVAGRAVFSRNGPQLLAEQGGGTAAAWWRNSWHVSFRP